MKELEWLFNKVPSIENKQLSKHALFYHLVHNAQTEFLEYMICEIRLSNATLQFYNHLIV